VSGEDRFGKEDTKQVQVIPLSNENVLKQKRQFFFQIFVSFKFLFLKDALSSLKSSLPPAKNPGYHSQSINLVTQ
jgi:hypothetical protein